MWDPQTLAPNAYATTPVPAPALLDSGNFLSAFRQGGTDQVNQNLIQGQQAAGKAAAAGDWKGASAAAFGSGNTQLGMGLTQFQQEQQQKAFSMLGNMAMLTGGDPAKWQRVVQSVRSAGYNVSPDFDDPTKGPQLAISMAGMAPQMFSQNLQKQELGIRQGEFGIAQGNYALEQSKFAFERAKSLYDNQLNAYFLSGGQTPMPQPPNPSDYAIGGAPAGGNALAAPSGGGAARMPPAVNYGAPGGMGAGNALAPQPQAPAAPIALPPPTTPAAPLAVPLPAPGGLAMGGPPPAMAQPQPAPAPVDPNLTPGVQAPMFAPSDPTQAVARAIGGPVPTPAAATGFSAFSPEDLKMIGLARMNPEAARTIQNSPEQSGRKTFADTMGKDAATLFQQNRKGQSLINTLNVLRSAIQNTPDNVLNRAIGPANITPLSDWLPGYGGMTVPAANAAIAQRLAPDWHWGEDDPVYNTQNLLKHLSGGLATDFLAAVGGDAGGSDTRFNEFKDTMSSMLKSTNKKAALDIGNHAETLLRSAFMMPPIGTSAASGTQTDPNLARADALIRRGVPMAEVVGALKKMGYSVPDTTAGAGAAQ